MYIPLSFSGVLENAYFGDIDIIQQCGNATNTEAAVLDKSRIDFESFLREHRGVAAVTSPWPVGADMLTRSSSQWKASPRSDFCDFDECSHEQLL